MNGWLTGLLVLAFCGVWCLYDIRKLLEKQNGMLFDLWRRQERPDLDDDF